jgi:hypothetical protein
VSKLIKPNTEINSVRLCIESMNLLSTHAELFQSRIDNTAFLEIASAAIDIGSSHSNQDIREASGELLTQVAHEIANSEAEDDESKKIATDVIKMLTQIWHDEDEHSLKIESTIKAGICPFIIFSWYFVKENCRDHG